MGVIARQENSILILALDNPERGNAFGLSEAEQMDRHIHQIPTAQLGGILFCSNVPKKFCSGGNLADYAELKDREEGIERNKKITEILTRLYELPVPTVAAVAGDCYGGGMELLSCFDYVASTPAAFFGFWQRRIALSCGWGGRLRTENRIGKALTSQLLLEARSLPAAQAFRHGLINEIVPEDKIMDHCREWLQQAGQWPTAPLEPLKKDRHLDEQTAFEKLWWNSEHKKVLKKYQTKSD